MESEAPHGWILGKLGQALDAIVAGRSPACPNEAATDGQWGVLKVSAVGQGAFHAKENKALDEGYSVPDALRVLSGDLLITRANTKELVGSVCAVPPGDYRLMLCDKVLRLEPNRSVARAFLLHCLNTTNFRRYIEVAATGSSGSMKNISQSDIRGAPIPVPPLPEQKKIAAILSSVDDAIQATQAVIEQTRRVKEGLLQELLTRGIGHARFKKTPVGEIPEGWIVRPLGQVARVFNGRGKRSGGSRTRLYKTKHIYDGPVLDHEPEYQPDEEPIPPDWAFLRSGDVLTPNMAHSTIGRVSWLKQVDGPTLCDGQVMVVRSNDRQRTRPRFLFDFLSADIGRRQLLAREVGSIFGPARGQTHLYPKDVETIQIPIPPIEEQHCLGSFQSLDDEINEHEKWLNQLRVTKSGLLHDLLTGKVRVTL